MSLETYTHCASPPSQQELQDLLQLCDIFSPNELEAASIVGPGNPEQLVQRLIDAGAATVALRCGAQGAWIGDRHSHTLIHVSVTASAILPALACSPQNYVYQWSDLLQWTQHAPGHSTVRGPRTDYAQHAP